MATKTYTSAVELTKDTWKFSTRDQKLALLDAIDADSSWADTKTIGEMTKRGGGLVANTLKRLSAEQLRRAGGSITINWK